jgi:UPF0755 protein
MKLFTETDLLNNTKLSYKKTIINSVIVFLLLLAAFCVYRVGSMFSPLIISESVVVEIPEGYSISQAATLLEQNTIIRSAAAVKIMNRVQPLSVKSGLYEFTEGSHSLQEVRMRLHNADYGDIYISLTIPEGSSRNEIVQIINRSELDIDTDEFLSLTQGREGYLFPDTYSVLPGTTAAELVEQFDETFALRTKDIRQQGVTPQRSFEDIIIMASLIEKEAGSDPVEMATIAGILWKRIDIGMPLQVDAPFLFTAGKTSAQLTTADLRTDGPYNTYTNRGLTPTPIGNPGIQAINAATNPLDSVYFFYLHDTNGGIHYGVTHRDHVNNKNTYLR